MNHSFEVAWDWDDVLAAPPSHFTTVRIGCDGVKQHMRVDFSTPVVSAGVRVIVNVREGSPLSEAARDFVTTTSLTVQDIVEIRLWHTVESAVCQIQFSFVVQTVSSPCSVRAVLERKSAPTCM